MSELNKFLLGVKRAYPNTDPLVCRVVLGAREYSIYISTSEPQSPATNVLWFDTMTLFQLVDNAPSPPYRHTWQEITLPSFTPALLSPRGQETFLPEVTQTQFSTNGARLNTPLSTTFEGSQPLEAVTRKQLPDPSPLEAQAIAPLTATTATQLELSAPTQPRHVINDATLQLLLQPLQRRIRALSERLNNEFQKLDVFLRRVQLLHEQLHDYPSPLDNLARITGGTFSSHIYLDAQHPYPIDEEEAVAYKYLKDEIAAGQFNTQPCICVERDRTVLAM